MSKATPAAPTALATQGSGALRRREEEAAIEALKAAGIDIDDKVGKEKLELSVTPPFLAAAQKTSPQLEDSSPKYIEGLSFLDLFDSQTNEIYGPGPVTFIPLSKKLHAIEFKPFDEGGGVVDRDVPLSDPRCKWNDDAENPKDRKPKATILFDVIALVGENLDLMVISFKSTSLKNGLLFDMLTKKCRAPLYAQRWTLSTVKTIKSTNSFAVLVPKAAGIADPETAIYAKSLLDTVVPKIEIEHEAEAESEVVQGEVVQPTAASAKPLTDADIPF